MNGREHSWVGGVRQRANATWPLCRLAMDAGGVTIGPSTKLLALFMPTYAIPWPRVAHVATTRGDLFGTFGVRFHLAEPVKATRRMGLAVLWPAAAHEPVFWARHAAQADDIGRAAVELSRRDDIYVPWSEGRSPGPGPAAGEGLD